MKCSKNAVCDVALQQNLLTIEQQKRFIKMNKEEKRMSRKTN